MRLIALPLTLLALALAAAAPAGAAEIVVFEDTDETVAAETSEREADLGFDAERRFTRAIRGFTAELSPEQERALDRDPEVEAVIPDRPVRMLGEVANLSGGIVPPGIRRSIDAPPGIVRESATHAVAVLDTGVDLEHPDLDVTPGTTCVGTGPPDDVHGHGTHVAGTIGAKNNGAGVAGIAPGTRIIAVKVLDDDGQGWTSTVLCGIEWVLANRVAFDIEVANLSLGGLGDPTTCADDPEHNAYCRLADAGITTVVAAGNDGEAFGASPPYVPASYPEVLTVAAMADSDGIPGGLGAATCSRPDDLFATFSNFATDAGDAAHLVAAPGVCIRSTSPGGSTAVMSGTSMASPHVAGLVALCHGEAGAEGPCSDLTPPQVIAHMVATAKATEGLGFTPDLANPTHLFGPFAVLPTSPPAPEDEPTGEAGTADPEPPAPAQESDPSPQGSDPPPVEKPAVMPVSAPEGPDPSAAGSDPFVRMTLSSARLRRFLRTGLVVRIGCQAGCRAKVRVIARGARLLARAEGRGRIVVRPTRSARRRLRRASRVIATVRADVRTRTGTVRLSRTVLLS